MIITLDGPCGSGKSTLAQLLAQKLTFFYVNSGYLYRALAYVLVKYFGYDAEKLHHPELADIAIIFDEYNFKYQYIDGVVKIFFKGQDITSFLKNSEVSDHASVISSDVHVRKAIVVMQRKFGSMYDIVTDGRDGGTEIYPHASYKFYVTAQVEIRAQRLQTDLEKTGQHIIFDHVLKMTLMRDTRDTTRLNSPLKMADDAILVDTSYQSIQQSLDFMVSKIIKTTC